MRIRWTNAANDLAQIVERIGEQSHFAYSVTAT